MSHRTRPAIDKHYPVHVTARLVQGLPSLRNPGTLRVLEGCLFRAKKRFRTRVLHYSIQTNHVHLIVETFDRHSLSRAMQGMFVRFAKRLNKHWGRKGRVFGDRYFGRGLDSLLEIRNAIVYVLRNSPHHGIHIEGIDPYSSGAWFDGWDPPLPRDPLQRPVSTCVRATRWPAKIGWRSRYGPIRLDELPRPAEPDERHTSPIGPRPS